MPTELRRCPWVTPAAGPAPDPLYVRYHDEEWGVPVHDDRHLFEMLILEGAQAGLSWRTILGKRKGYRRVFEGFDAKKLARWGTREIARALKDEGIVRNRLKVESSVTNAQALLGLQKAEGSLDAFAWAFVGGRPIVTRPHPGEVQPRTPESDALSKALKTRGFRFVGSTIIYAWMQACGLADDHSFDCFRGKARRR
jgi:DNA-3-methyladenine glycosylase I